MKTLPNKLVLSHFPYTVHFFSLQKYVLCFHKPFVFHVASVMGLYISTCTFPAHSDGGALITCHQTTEGAGVVLIEDHPLHVPVCPSKRNPKTRAPLDKVSVCLLSGR